MEYFDKLKKSVRAAYSTLKEDAMDLILKPIFVRGLLAKIYDGLKYRDFSNVHEAVKSARYAESQLFREDLYRNPKVDNSINTLNVTDVTTMKSLTKELKQEIKDLRELLLKRPQHAENREMECGKSGHRANDCRSKACFGCGAFGHIAKSCPKARDQKRKWQGPPAGNNWQGPPAGNNWQGPRAGNG